MKFEIHSSYASFFFDHTSSCTWTVWPTEMYCPGRAPPARAAVTTRAEFCPPAAPVPALVSALRLPRLLGLKETGAASMDTSAEWDAAPPAQSRCVLCRLRLQTSPGLWFVSAFKSCVSHKCFGSRFLCTRSCICI